MPRLTRKLPSYRLHKRSGQAVVTLNGRDHYLGPFNSPESWEEYRRLIAEWLATGRRRVSSLDGPAGNAGPDDVTINELILAFWRHAARHYRLPNGHPSKELANFRDSLRPLRQLYGETIAAHFSPLRLKAFRQTLIDSGLCRNTINRSVTEPLSECATYFLWLSPR